MSFGLGMSTLSRLLGKPNLQQKTFFIEETCELNSSSLNVIDYRDSVLPQELFNGHCVFHGEGGAGKTHLVKQLIKDRSLNATIVVLDSDRGFSSLNGPAIGKNYYQISDKVSDVDIPLGKVSLFGLSEVDYGDSMRNAITDLFSNVVESLMKSSSPTLLIVSTHWLPNNPVFWSKIQTLIQMGHVKLWIIDSLFNFDGGVLRWMEESSLRWLLFHTSLPNYNLLGFFLKMEPSFLRQFADLPTGMYLYIDENHQLKFIGTMLFE